MLNYQQGNNTLYSFADFNPSIVGHKIRWVKNNPTSHPRGEEGMYLTVVCYSEQSDEIYGDDDTIHLERKIIRLRTPTGENLDFSPHEKFATNFPKYLTSGEKFSPTMDLGSYTYHEIGADIVGNCVMVATGSDTNHPWSDFITGRVMSYKPSGAVSYLRIHPNSVMYEVRLEGVDRPIVVDSYSLFWA